MSSTHAPQTNDQQSDKSKALRAFFTTDESKVEIYLNPKYNKDNNQPALTGKINSDYVSLFLQPGGVSKDGKEYSPFFNIRKSGEKQEDGSYAKSENIGNANMVVTQRGEARLVLAIEGKDAIFATPRKEVTELLPEFGLNVELQQKRKAATQAARNNEKLPEPETPSSTNKGPRPY